jgi:hypothetical protein
MELYPEYGPRPQRLDIRHLSPITGCWQYVAHLRPLCIETSHLEALLGSHGLYFKLLSIDHRNIIHAIFFYNYTEHAPCSRIHPNNSSSRLKSWKLRIRQLRPSGSTVDIDQSRIKEEPFVFVINERSAEDSAGLGPRTLKVLSLYG